MAFSLPMFRRSVPEGWRFWIILMFPLVFQMSDPMFMGLSTEVSSALSLWNEDILFCGYAGMIGVTMTFPILFRLKFRFTTRKIFLMVCLGMATISCICMHIRCVSVLIILSFLFGVLKLWGSFEGFSSIMLKVAPRYNFAPFLAVVFLVVFCAIEISGIIGVWIVHIATWKHMHYLTIGLQLVMACVAFFGMRDFRPIPKQGLAGISWVGLVLWAIVLLAFTFICVYGDNLDWFNSPYINVAVGVILLTLGVIVARTTGNPGAYIPFKAFRYRNVVTITVVFLIACVMMSTESTLQHIFTHEVLDFDPYGSISLKVAVLLGLIAGGWFGYYAIEHLGIGVKNLTLLCVLLLTMYAISMCLLISPDTALHHMWLPLFLFGMGHVLLFVVLTTYIEGVVPLEHRFHALTILGFARIGAGTALGCAVFGFFFKGALKHNIALLGSSANAVTSSHVPIGDAMSEIVRQAMMLSLKELFALAVLLGIITMIIIGSIRYRKEVKFVYDSWRDVILYLYRHITPTRYKN